MQSRITRGGIIAAVGILISSFGAGQVPRAAAQEPAAAIETLTAKGEWTTGVVYNTDDVVTARGSTWRAIRRNRNRVPGQTEPSTAAFWELLASGFNSKGAWSSTRKYHPNDLVISNGSTWRAKLTNRNTAPVPGATWQLFAARGAKGATGAGGLQGPPGPNTGVPDGTSSAPAISFNGDADTGIFSPADGKIALVENGEVLLHTSGATNTALGPAALASITSGFSNTAVGHSALTANTEGTSNTAIGNLALAANTTGEDNTAVGDRTLRNTTSEDNTALGSSALFFNTTGIGNTALGSDALFTNEGGSFNIAVGRSAGENADNPSNSIFIGNTGQSADSATIKIGTQGTQTSAFIAGISNRAAMVAGVQVYIDSVTGQLSGPPLSSARYKEDIQPVDDLTGMLNKLRPVTFRYKEPAKDGSKPIQYGLIAEEVAEVMPYLAVFNPDGTLRTVHYERLPTFLLAGWQVQQKTIAAQADRIEALEERMRRLEALVPQTKAAALQ